MSHLSRQSLKSCVLLAVTTTWFLMPDTSAATESLREPLAKIAKAVSQVLQDRGADTIAIGEFGGPPSFATAAGPGIRKVLAEEFAKVGIREKKIGAEIGIQGKYLVHQDQPNFAGAEKGPPRLRIVASLVDRNGQVLSEMNAEVSVKVGEEDGKPIIDKTKIASGTLTVDSFGASNDIGGKGALAETLGATIDLQQKAAAGGPVSSDLVVDSFQHPTAAILAGGTAVASSRASPYYMEILVNGQPRAITLEDGHPYTELMKDDHFQIRFTNRATHDVAVTFQLDGVNSYGFSEVRYTDGPRRGEPKYQKWIVPRGQTFVLKGWHKTNDYVEKFLVTDFADSAAAKLGSVNGLGTITASVRATWRKADEPPPDEIISYATGVGIGFGGRDTQQVQEDAQARDYGQLRSVITVRYTKPDGQ